MVLSGENFWRRDVCNTVEGNNPAKFFKGGFFYRTERVVLESTKNLTCRSVDVACFSWFRISIDNIIKYEVRDICIGHNEWAKNATYHHFNIDICAKTVTPVTLNCG